jgi:hypothetical protein
MTPPRAKPLGAFINATPRRRPLRGWRRPAPSRAG